MGTKTDYAGHELRYRELRRSGAEGWDRGQDLADHLAELELYDRCEAVPRAGRLLELGCGAGDMSLRYARRGFEVVGIDISPTAVDWAREKADAEGLAAEFRVGDVLALDVEPSSFDVVLDGHCLHCIIGEDRPRFFEGARRALRPDGALLIGTMCGEVTSARILEVFHAGTRCTYRGDVATRYIGDPDALLREIEDAGLSIVTQEIAPRRSEDDQDVLLVVARLRG